MEAPSIYTVFVIAAILSVVNCQTPSLNGDGLYFVENQTRTMLCYVSSLEDLSSFPLTWEKDGLLMTGRGESKTSPSLNFYVYSSYLDLPVQASDNGKSITCKYKNQSPGSSWIIYVKKPPDYPTLTGEVNVTWGQTYNWTCTVGGATTLLESDVSLTFSNASANSSSISSKSSSSMGAYNITTYTVTKVLTLTIPRNSSDFTVSCTVGHDLLPSSRAAVLSLTVLYPPVVTVNTISYTAVIRTTTTLSCLVTAHPSVTSVTWYKDGSLLNRTSGRFQNGDTVQPSLTVTNVQREDGGQYTCGASNSMGSTNGSAILLTVVYPPEVTYSKKVFGGNVGTSLTVTCTIDAKPGVSNVSWWRINSTDGSKSLISLTASAGRYSGGTTTTPSLTINNLTASDAGLYRCGADNDVGSGEGDNVEVQVFYTPAVTVSATSYVRNETDTLVITCSYDASPAPFNVTWTRNSQSVDVAGSGGKYGGATVATPSLTVTRLARSDSGVYVCSVTNTIGTGHSRDVTVQVNYLPIINTPVTYYNGSRGGSVTMKCEVTANPAPTGISWYKDGSLVVTSGSGGKYSGGTTSTSDLTINNLVGNDTGKYICKAVNSLGSTESSNITLDVTYAPIVTLSATSYTRNETETLVITCSYEGNPAPFNVTWTRNSQSVDVAGSGGKYGGATVATPSLTVTRLARSDAGVYVCSVTNTIGTGHSPDVTVQVNYLPIINTPVTYYNGSRGGSVTMKCEVTANPAPTGISWYKDGSLVVTSGSGGKYSGGTTSTPDLTVNTLSGNDTGKYICKAVNSLGSTESSNITLEVTYAPIVTLSATSYTRNETETLVITCSYEGNPAPFNVTWTRNSQRVDVAGSGGKYGGATVATPSLTVTRLARSDAGVYVCSVTNTIGTGHSPDVTVIVNYSPVVNSPVTYYNGSRSGSVTMKCEVTANPAPTGISWYKDGSLVVTSGSGSKYSGGTTSTPDLTVNFLSGSDTGLYFCAAINSLGSTNGTDIRLEVTYAPLITSSSAPLTGIELSSITLPCTYDANPSPTRVLWTKNSVNITLPSSPYTGGTPGTPSLTILSLTPEDTGSYACTVVNSLGNASTGAILVTVQYAPRVDSGPVGQRTIQIGQDVTIPCNVSAVPAVTSVTWLRDGAVLSVNAGARYSGGTVSTPALTIRNVVRSDAATYTCRVTNAVGTREGANVTLVVQYAPLITSSSASLTGVEMSPLTLPCTYDANPSPSYILWTKNFSNITLPSSPYTGGTPSTPSLTILSLTPEDTGSYACAVVNSIGIASTGAILVTVQFAPKVDSGSDGQKTTQAGQNVTIPCNVSAVPAATLVTWLRDGAVLPVNDSAKYSGGTVSTPGLTIRNVVRSDAATYTCRVTNAVGTREGANVTLVVQYKPVVKVPQSISGNESQVVTISCDVAALPEVMSLRWKKDGQLLNTTGSARYSGGNVTTPSLTLNSLGAEDVGNYSCVADNSVGSTESAGVFLSVQYAPIFTVPRTEVGGVEGQAVNLSLSINANPEVTTVRWYRLDATSSVWSQIDIVSTSKYSGGTAHTPSLIISALDSGDWGDYQAEATNVINTRRSLTIKVAVSYKPTSPNIMGNAGSYKEGEAIVLTCLANGFPTPLYDWYRDSIVYQQNNSVLNISSASPTDNTQFKCRAVNSLGYSEASVSIVVQYKPRPSSTLSNKTADIGESVTLSCDVDSNPAPTNYTWFFNGSVVSTGNKTLQVTVDASRLGIYTCIASNSQGDSNPVDIVVTQNTDSPNKPTSPNIMGNAGIYKEGEAIVLTCLANGFPTPVYDWYRDSIVYQQNNSVLNISSASPTDNTTFKCRAVNSLGYSEASVSIVVEYKPRRSPTLSNTTADIGESVTLSCDVDSNPAPTNYTWFFNGSVVSTGSKTLQVTVDASRLGIYTCIASNSQGDSNPVDIVVTQNTATDSPKTGESTEASGLSVATMVLIIIICIIVAVVIVLAIIYFCSGSRCTRKKNEVRQAPADAPVTFPEVKPGKNRLPPLNSAPPPSTAPPPSAASPTRGKVSVDDELLSPRSAPKEESRLGNGVIISMPGGLGGAPRPYRLRPLNTAGVGSGEVEPATDRVDEPTRKTTKKKRKRKLQLAEDLTSEVVSPHQSLDRLLQDEDDSVDV